jgi:hypothetical protein
MADCEWIILCDHAFPDWRGKLSLIGVFDAINAVSVPATHERASIGFAIIGEPGEELGLTLEIIGPTGKVILKAEIPTTTLPESGAGFGQLDLRNLVLTDFGRHAIQINLGDGATKAAWFTLRQVRPQ